MSSGSELNGRILIGCAAAFIGAVALGLLALIVFMGSLGIREVHRQADLIEHAVQVEATVVSSEVRRLTGGGSPNSAARAERYVPEVRFEFPLDGNAVTGQRVFPVPRNGDRAWASRIVSRYPAGGTATAWVDPARPDDAFLEKEWVLGPYAMLLAVAVALAVLTAIVSAVTFLVPTVARLVALIGVVGAILVPVYAGIHYWSHARAAGAGLGLPELLGLAALVAALLPLAGLVQGQRWRRKIVEEGTVPTRIFDTHGDDHPGPTIEL